MTTVFLSIYIIGVLLCWWFLPTLLKGVGESDSQEIAHCTLFVGIFWFVMLPLCIICLSFEKFVSWRIKR